MNIVFLLFLTCDHILTFLYQCPEEFKLDMTTAWYQVEDRGFNNYAVYSFQQFQQFIFSNNLLQNFHAFYNTIKMLTKLSDMLQHFQTGCNIFKQLNYQIFRHFQIIYKNFQQFVFSNNLLQIFQTFYNAFWLAKVSNCLENFQTSCNVFKKLTTKFSEILQNLLRQIIEFFSNLHFQPKNKTNK